MTTLNYVMVGLHIRVSFVEEQSGKVSWKNYSHIVTLVELMREGALLDYLIFFSLSSIFLLTIHTHTHTHIKFKVFQKMILQF